MENEHTMSRKEMNVLEINCQDAVKWLQENACPHDKIIITQTGIEYLNGRCYIPKSPLD